MRVSERACVYVAALKTGRRLDQDSHPRLVRISKGKESGSERRVCVIGLDTKKSLGWVVLVGGGGGHNVAVEMISKHTESRQTATFVSAARDLQ